MRILLVEDDPLIADAVKNALTDNGCDVRHEASGPMGLAAATLQAPDVVLLDLGLPGMDGLALLRALRAQKSPLADVPVLIITARDALENRLEGLDAGADDYLVKPFHVAELIARVRAVLRRKAPAGAKETLEAAGVTLNTVTHVCVAGDTPVTLSKREYALLAALMERPGAILSRRALEERLYAPGDEPESNAVEYLIHSLRKKVGGNVVQNVRGLGWRVSPAEG